MSTYLFVTDETNLGTGNPPGKPPRFFMYGGVIVPVEKVGPLHRDIEAIRKEHGFKPTDELKFTHAKSAVPEEAHRAAKAAVIAAAKTHGVLFVANLVHQGLVKNQPPGETVGWGANTVIGRFNYFLRKVNGDGLVVVDRFGSGKGGEYSYLREKFQRGLIMTKRREDVPLERICGYMATCSGASHLSSVVDVVLGAFRYCVDKRGEGGIAAALFPEVVDLMWRNGTRIRDYGLIIPKVTGSMQDEYEELLEPLRDLIRQGEP